MFYIYEIKNIKVGCTNNIFKRIIIQQGYYNYKILDKTKCINEASKLELEWQEKLGYKKDLKTYKETINNLKTKKMIHVTDHTITFKKTFNKELDNFILPVVIELNDGFIIPVDDEIKKFILKNNYKSQNNDERYIYTNSLKNYYEVLEDSKKTNDQYIIFDLIRQWAKDRGIYAKGNSHTQYVKLIEEAGELAQALLNKDPYEVKDAIGDMVIVLTNLAVLEGMQIENCIDSAYNEIASRKGEMINGTFVKN